jgi:hypothetical protein
MELDNEGMHQLKGLAKNKVEKLTSVLKELYP